MSTAVQIGLFLASMAVVVLVVCVIPFVYQLRRNLDHLIKTTDELKSELKPLMQDTREVLQNLKQISERTNEQMDEVEKVVQTVRDWSNRADRLVDEVGSALEPPILTAARNINIFRKGITTFVEYLLHRNQHAQLKEKENHVRQ